MNKGAKIGIIVAVVVGALGGLYALGLSAGNNSSEQQKQGQLPETVSQPDKTAQENQQQPEETKTEPVVDNQEQSEEAVVAQLIDAYPWMDEKTAKNVWFSGSQKMKDNPQLADVIGENPLFIDILTDGSWTGTAQGSDFVQKSDDGYGRGANIVSCEPGGIYSAVYQMQTGSGEMRVVVYQDGEVLKTGYTDADYGVVSVSGSC